MRAILFSFIALTLVVSGCKKKNDPVVPKLKTTIVPDLLSGAIDTSDYIYNGDGKVASIENRNGAKQVFTYSGNTITCVYYSPDGKQFETITYFLNSAGLADSCVDAYTGGQVFYRSNRYDDKGFITMRRFYGPTNALTGITTWSNNGTNITGQQEAHASGHIVATTGYEFFTGNKSSIEHANMGMPFLGKRYGNTLKSQTTSGSLNYQSTFTYTYDTEGRVTSMSVYDGTGSLRGVNEYSYE